MKNNKKITGLDIGIICSLIGIIASALRQVLVLKLFFMIYRILECMKKYIDNFRVNKVNGA